MLQISPLKHQIRPFKHQISPLRLQIHSLRLQIYPVRLQICQVSLETTLLDFKLAEPAFSDLKSALREPVDRGMPYISYVVPHQLTRAG